MRHAYGIDSQIAAGYDGTGRTIVIVDAFDYPAIPNVVPGLDADFAAFNTLYGLPAATINHVYPDGVPGFDSGWAGEMALDVEWAHAIAPGAKIVLVHAITNEDSDILSAIKYAVDHNLGDVISMSFGDNESCVGSALLASYHDVFAAATEKGITLFASSGDEGAALPTCDGDSWEKAVSSPASDPLVTAVGGTELRAADYPIACTDTTMPGCAFSAVSPTPGTYQSEIAWNEDGAFGDFPGALGGTTIATGGGFSVLFDAPPWQKSIPGGKARAVPDVAYNGAVLHGVLGILFGQCCFRFGGTSAGSPQWAAITAIADQKAGGRLGFLNSAIYQIGRVNNAYPVSFHDVTLGTNSSSQEDANGDDVVVNGFSAGSSWDATTGLGSPMQGSLVDNLIRYVSPGDGQAAISTTKPKNNPKPVVPGHMDTH